MKPSLFFFLALLSAASAEEPAVRSPWNVQVELQVVTMPEEVALPLLPELRNAKTIEAAFAKLQKLISSKQATLIGWPSLTTQSGSKGVIESTDEIRYATEFQPPTIGSESVADNLRKAIPVVFEATPTQFEVRNTGISLEVDPTVLEEGKFIQFELSTHHDRLKGFNKIALEKPKQGITVVVEQPDFENNRTTTTLRLRNGSRILVGVHKTSTLPNQIELQILKIDAEKVE